MSNDYAARLQSNCSCTFVIASPEQRGFFERCFCTGAKMAALIFQWHSLWMTQTLSFELIMKEFIVEMFSNPAIIRMTKRFSISLGLFIFSSLSDPPAFVDCRTLPVQPVRCYFNQQLTPLPILITLRDNFRRTENGSLSGFHAFTTWPDSCLKVRPIIFHPLQNITLLHFSRQKYEFIK